MAQREAPVGTGPGPKNRRTALPSFVGRARPSRSNFWK